MQEATTGMRDKEIKNGSTDKNGEDRRKKTERCANIVTLYTQNISSH